MAETVTNAPDSQGIQNALSQAAEVFRKRVDALGVEVLDELGLPLLIDAYPHEERYQGFQLYQRGKNISAALQQREQMLYYCLYLQIVAPQSNIDIFQRGIFLNCGE